MSCLARRVYEQQLILGLPGLASEVTEICQTISISDVNFYTVTKDKIYEHVFYHHYIYMKEQLESSKKMSSVKHEDFTSEESYFNDKSIDRCRTKFRVRTESCKSHKDDYRAKYRTLARGRRTGTPACSAANVANVAGRTGTPSPTAWSVLPGQRPGTDWI